MLFAITGGKQVELTKNDKIWHKEKFEIGKTIESKIHTLPWDFESELRKVKETHVTLQDNEKKILWVVVMASPNKRNVNDNWRENVKDYRSTSH